MQIELDYLNEKIVREKVASGAYASADDVIREALRLLEERDNSNPPRSERESREITIGVEQADRGEVIILDEDAISQIKANSRRRFGILRSR